MFDLRNRIFEVLSAVRWFGVVIRALLRGERGTPTTPGTTWNTRPGLSVMYQIETRPGWEWDRDFDAFNDSMTDNDGNLVFNGPYPRMDEWVALSEEIGLDYHSFEIKWHDGICWFNTETTTWVSDRDYTREFTDLSRKAGIPVVFYYSSVFDHNPQFDGIQPDRKALPSLIGNKVEYQEYLRRHYAEIIEQYRPDGMWFDWYWADGSTETTVEEFRSKYPDTTVFFNLSNLFPTSFDRIDITSSEAHRYSGPWVHLRKEHSMSAPVLTSSVKWANAMRQCATHQWELCSPAGKWWQDQTLREDTLELPRMVAMILACGGKLHIGATSQMDGRIFPDQLTQLRLIGEWYKPRKHLFVDATPLRYKGFRAPGVKVSAGRFDTVASAYQGHHLLHLVNADAHEGALTIEVTGRRWSKVRRALLQPTGEELPVTRVGNRMHIALTAEQVDPVDTIIELI